MPDVDAPARRRLRRVALAAVATNVLIVASGGLVRVTGSGLGCPTWPRCDADSLVPTPGGAHAGWQTAVEFGNRLLTFVVLAAALAVWWEVRRHRHRLPQALVPLSWALPGGVLAQALLGGVTVLTGLSPLVVAAHFLLSMALIALSAAVLELVRPPGHAGADTVGGGVRAATWALVIVGGAVLVLGTLVTGAGPHGGDPGSARLGIDIRPLALAHADGVWAFVGLGVALVAVTWRGPRRLALTARALLGLQLLQGAIGYWQYATGIPEPLVSLHILGASLVWLAACLVWLRARPELAAPPTGDRADDQADDRLSARRPTARPTAPGRGDRAPR